MARLRAMKFLLDENISPRLARSFCAFGLDVIHLADRALLSARDDEILDRAIAEDRIVVTRDGDDFSNLCAACGLHPGLIVIGDGFTHDHRAMVWSSFAHIAALADRDGESPRSFMVNEVVEADVDLACRAYSCP